MRRCLYYLLMMLPLGAILGQDNIGINNPSPDVSSILDITSTDKGLLIPRMTAAQKDLIDTPATGLLIYQTDANLGFFFYDGSAWKALASESSSWSVSGNSETINGTNFIGTTNDQAIDFKTNDVIKVRLTTKGQLEILNTGYSVFIGEGAGENDNLSSHYNVFVGTSAGAANSFGGNNTAIGGLSLSANNFGFYNSAVGYKSLNANTTGTGNTAFGCESLSGNTTGSDNISVGYNSLKANSTGYSNAGIGSSSLNKNTTGYSNTGIGQISLYNSTTGSKNTANGAESLYANTTGSQNSAVGYQGLNRNTTGNYNTAVGAECLSYSTVGDYNTALGYASFTSVSTISNSTAIGYNAQVFMSNQITVGNSSIALIGGYTSWSNLSDRRFKKNIQSNVPGLDFINKLNPVTYQLDVDKLNNHLNVKSESGSEESKGRVIQSGFIAQEVEESAKELNYDFSGVYVPENDEGHYALRYSEFTVPLVKAVQELSIENQALRLELKQLSERLDQIEGNN